MYSQGTVDIGANCSNGARSIWAGHICILAQAHPFGNVCMRQGRPQLRHYIVQALLPTPSYWMGLQTLSLVKLIK